MVQRVLGRPAVLPSEDTEADKPDARADPPAVLEELVERLIARPIEIHRDAVNYVIEGGPRQVEGVDPGLESPSLPRRRRLARVAARQLLTPRLECLARGNGVIITSSLVHGPAKIPDRNDGAALSVGRTRNE